MKCSRCRNEVARTYGPEQICATCTLVDEAGEGQSLARVARIEPDYGTAVVPRETDVVREKVGSTLIDEIVQKKQKFHGRPAKRRSDKRPTKPMKVIEAEKISSAADKSFTKAQKLRDGKSHNGKTDAELPEKDILLTLNHGQWRIVRKLLVAGFHGNTVEEVCLRILDAGLEKRL